MCAVAFPAPATATIVVENTFISIKSEGEQLVRRSKTLGEDFKVPVVFSPRSSVSSRSSICSVSSASTAPSKRGSVASVESVRGNRKAKPGKDLPIFEHGEQRTTLMLRNIPNKYDPESLLEEFAAFDGCFDFFYLPVDTTKNLNLGYAFMNFTSPAHAERFSKAFAGVQILNRSAKRMRIEFARLQGWEQSVSHFRNSAVANGTNLGPMVFSNGERVAFPVRA